MSREGMIGVIHIYTSKNNTHVHLTDITGAETISNASCGHVVKRGAEEKKPWAAMKTTEKIVDDAMNKGVNAVHIKIRAPGGIKSKISNTPGSNTVIRTISRSPIRVLSIEDVTPIPHDGCKSKGGRRGRRP